MNEMYVGLIFVVLLTLASSVKADDYEYYPDLNPWPELEPDIYPGDPNYYAPGHEPDPYELRQLRNRVNELEQDVYDIQDIQHTDRIFPELWEATRP